MKTILFTFFLVIIGSIALLTGLIVQLVTRPYPESPLAPRQSYINDRYPPWAFESSELLPVPCPTPTQ